MGAVIDGSVDPDGGIDGVPGDEGDEGDESPHAMMMPTSTRGDKKAIKPRFMLGFFLSSVRGYPRHEGESTSTGDVPAQDSNTLA